MSQSSILSKLHMVPFQPLPLLSSGTAQTLASYYFPFFPFISHQHQHVVPLPDSDKLVIVENRPLKWRDSQRIVLLVHGLTGSEQSKYLIRAARLLLAQGFMVIRMNLRGCGLGTGLAKHLYHSGRSEDLRTVINWLQVHFPNSPVTTVGFSLGANIALKLAGEDGRNPSGNLDSTVAISPPLDLYSSVKLIIHPRNRLFNHYFIKGLMRDVKKLHTAFPELTPTQFPAFLNVLEFDNLFTAPHNGFKDAIDYYTRCSSYQFVENISLPTFILYAQDDPVITRQKFFKLPKKSNLDVLITQKGGHVGWLGASGKHPYYRWMDSILGKWVNWFDKGNTR